VGLILVKELLLVNPSKGTRVDELKMRPIPKLDEETPMYDLLKLFETGRSHMCVVTHSSSGRAAEQEEDGMSSSGKEQQHMIDGTMTVGEQQHMIDGIMILK
jgi:metal transporter CNNM